MPKVLVTDPISEGAVNIRDTQWVKYGILGREEDLQKHLDKETKELKAYLKNNDWVKLPLFEDVRHYASFKKIDKLVELIKSEMHSNTYSKLVIFAIHADLMKLIFILLGEFTPRTIYAKSNPATVEKNVKSFNAAQGKCRIIISTITAARVLPIFFEKTSACIFLETDPDPNANLIALSKIKSETIYARSFYLESDPIDKKIEEQINKDMSRPNEIQTESRA